MTSREIRKALTAVGVRVVSVRGKRGMVLIDVLPPRFAGYDVAAFVRQVGTACDMGAREEDVRIKIVSEDEQ